MSRTIFDEVRNFEVLLGLPTDFYLNLIREDDWSFVIKLNAMFEGACTHALSTRLQAPELADALAQLDFANTKFGKVALLHLLGAINADQDGVLQTLASLRNKLVHNIANVSFSFAEYVEAMDKNQLKETVKRFGLGASDTIQIGNKCVPKAKFVRENPKVSLWLTAAEILACLYVEFEVAELRVKKLALDELSRLTAPFSTSAISAGE